MVEEPHPHAKDDEAEALARLQEQIRRMSVSDHLMYMLESLSALATRKLGLAPDAAAERDLDQARMAIDAFKALLLVMESSRPQPEVGLHRQVLSQLQLAYVQVVQDPAQGRPEKVEQPAEEEQPESGEEPVGDGPVAGEPEGETASS